MYEIIIKRKEVVRKKCRGGWKVVAERPLSTKDVEDSYFNKNLNDYRGVLKQIYGYTPDFEDDVEEEHEVLKQTVVELNLVGVIKAINCIE